LGNILLDYQKRFLADDHPIVVCEKSRRVGISWAEAARAVLNAAGQDGADVFYMVYNFEAARAWIDHDVKEWAITLNAQARQAGQTLWEQDDEAHESVYAYHVEFASGHKIYGLTSRARSIRSRGRPGELVIIDEAAFHDRLADVLKAALAFTQLGGHVHIISTHNGATSPFNTLVTDIRAGRMSHSYSLHRVTIDDALADGYYQRVAAPLRHEEPTSQNEAQYRAELFATFRENADEELLVIPSESGGVFLSAALIERQMREGIPVLRGKGPTALDQIWPGLDMALRTLHPHQMSIFGVDFGRSGDLTVIWVLQIEQNTKRRTAFVVELRDVEYEKQKEILFTIVDRLRAGTRFIGGAMDASGNGAFLAEVAGLRYGGTKERPGLITPVVMNIEWYREQMPKYKAAFEDDMITLPKDADILADHRMLRMEKGVARVPESRSKETSGAGMRHGDSAIAGALALYASYQGQRQEYAYITPGSQIPVAYDPQRQRDLEEDYRGSERAWGSSGRRGHGLPKHGTF
jgi:phage FluMu gp28-like protein